MASVKRINGKDDESNFITGIEYKGKLLDPVRTGYMVWLETQSGELYHTDFVYKVKGNIIRTSKAVYEVIN